jgi:prepilin peptidase CpaA
MMSGVLLGSLFVYLALAVGFDLHSRRIPNVISGPALLVGLVLNAAQSGTAGLLGSLGGAALSMGILMLPFAAGGIGGGDVKMMGAVGAFVGPWIAVMGLVIGMIVGGVIMSVHLARLGRLRDTLASLVGKLGVAVGTGSVRPLLVRPEDDDVIALPYSVPLAIGAVIAIGLGRGIG